MVDRLFDIEDGADVAADVRAIVNVTDASGAAGASSVPGTSRKIRSIQPFDSRRNWTSKISRPYEPATRSAMARILSMSCVKPPSKTKSGHRPTSGLAGSTTNLKVYHAITTTGRLRKTPAAAA